MWFWWAFLAAIMAAVSVVLTKKALKNISAPLVTWVLFSLNTPIVALIAFKDGITQVNYLFFVGAIGSASIFAIAKTLRLVAIKQALLSKIAPLATFNAVFVYLLGLIFLSEKIQLMGVVGLLLITMGAYILNAEELGKDLLKPFRLLITEKASLLFLLGVALTSVTAIFDKVSITNTFPTNPSLTLLMENIIVSFLLLIYLQKKKKGWLSELKENFKFLSLTSLVYMVAVIAVFSAFATGPVALVIGIKQLQLFFVLFLSYLAFKDKPTKHSLLASVIMVAGVVLIKLT